MNPIPAPLPARIVLASNNPGKLREFASLFAPLGTTLVPQGELNVPEAAEPHLTFVENALAKARQASQLTGLPAIADDSGLCVAALADAPGVRSARYAQDAGAGHGDQANNALLMAELQDAVDRRARYVAVLVMVRSHDDPLPWIAHGEWHGEIARAPSGTHGFGYDPCFLLPELGVTVAELDPAEKNRLSHRARAWQALLAQWNLAPVGEGRSAHTHTGQTQGSQAEGRHMQGRQMQGHQMQGHQMQGHQMQGGQAPSSQAPSSRSRPGAA